jgi:hypothetical protein
LEDASDLAYAKANSFAVKYGDATDLPVKVYRIFKQVRTATSRYKSAHSTVEAWHPQRDHFAAGRNKVNYFSPARNELVTNAIPNVVGFY